MKPIIIGLTGFAHSGKDTTADYLLLHLSRQYKVIKVALADQLKIICQKLVYMFYGVLIPLEDFYDLQKKESVRDGLPSFASQPFKIRTVLQQIGTEIFRDLISSSVWCNYIKDKYIDAGQYDLIIISDLRMPDELEYFQKLVKTDLVANFITFRIVRDNRDQLAQNNQNHRSEHFITTMSVTDQLINDSTLEELYKKIDKQIIDLISKIMKKN